MGCSAVSPNAPSWRRAAIGCALRKPALCAVDQGSLSRGGVVPLGSLRAYGGEFGFVVCALQIAAGPDYSHRGAENAKGNLHARSTKDPAFEVAGGKISLT